MNTLRWLCVVTTTVLLACGAADEPDDDTETADSGSSTADPDDSTDITWTALSIEDQLTRVSLSLRGIRPTVEELETVTADRNALSTFVDTWLDDPALGITIRDMYAEYLLMRASSLRSPLLGPIEDETVQLGSEAMSEEPLALIARVVTEDLPFSTIVTADWSVLTDVAARVWSGHNHDGSAGEQVVSWTDGRPTAGILSTNGLWARYPSNGANYHRARANVIADRLLCADFLTRDVPIDGSIDLTDDAAVADAVNESAECVSCHQALDPLSAHMWVFQQQLRPGRLIQAYADGCPDPSQCYPQTMYVPDAEDRWERLGLRAPGYYGRPTDDLTDLGAEIAADPRFSQCTARHMYGWFAQVDPDEVPIDVAIELQEVFEGSNLSAKALIRAIMLHERFLSETVSDEDLDATVPGTLLVRPEQVGRMVEDLTGFNWTLVIDGSGCANRSPSRCYGDVELTRDDTTGVRAMTGGVDGERVTRPTHTPTPTKLMFTAALAEEAAAFVVDADFALDAEDRRLLGAVDANTTDEATIRAQLAVLHGVLLGELVEGDDDAVDASYALFLAALDHHGNATMAWKITLTGLLQAPRALFY